MNSAIVGLLVLKKKNSICRKSTFPPKWNIIPLLSFSSQIIISLFCRKWFRREKNWSDSLISFRKCLPWQPLSCLSYFFSSTHTYTHTHIHTHTHSITHARTHLHMLTLKPGSLSYEAKTGIMPWIAHVTLKHILLSLNHFLHILCLLFFQLSIADSSPRR